MCAPHHADRSTRERGLGTGSKPTASIMITMIRFERSLALAFGAHPISTDHPIVPHSTLAARVPVPARQRRQAIPKTLVSVLTPSYNQARWLPANLRSVSMQSYPFIEHIVMDGGSTDGSAEILAATSLPVTWNSSPDGGQSDAINKAFRRSNGTILGWLNSDDAYFSRDVVTRVAQIFARRPEVGVVYGHAALVNASGVLLQVLWAPPFSKTFLRRYNFISQPSVFFRRDIIDRDGLVDLAFDYKMDRELWLYLSSRTQFVRLNRIVAIDRHHRQRKSYTRPDLAIHDQQLLLERYRLPRLASSRLFVKGAKIGIRLAGLAKVAEAARGSDVLALEIPSLGKLATRQLTQIRRWMPLGDE